MTYYLDGLPEGATMAIVETEQPPKPPNHNFEVLHVANDRVFMQSGGIMIDIKLPYPLGAKVGVREQWRGETCKRCGRIQRLAWSISDELWKKVPAYYLNKVLCLECAIDFLPELMFDDITFYEIAREDITRWLGVKSVAVKQIKELSGDEIQAAGYKYLHRMPAILDPKKFDKDKIHGLCNFVAQGVFIEQDEKRTPDTWVEVVGLKEV